MTYSGWGRAVVVGLAVLLVQGCASVAYEGRSGFSLPDRASFPSVSTLVSAHRSSSLSEDEERAEAEARRSEVEWTLARMWEVASGEARVGSVLELTFWVEGGAFTLVDSVRLAGAFTLEQLALCVVGGLVGKGMHMAFEAMAPTVIRGVTRGGAAGMRWFRTQLVRAGRKDQELLRRLFTRVETEGFESLSAAERGELTENPAAHGAVAHRQGV